MLANLPPKNLRWALAYNWFKNKVKLLHYLALTTAIIFINSGFSHYSNKLNSLANKEVLPLDLRRGYDLEEVMAFFEAIGPEGRQIYWMLELLLDGVYPLVYTFFFILVLVGLLEKGVSANMVGNLYKFCFFPVLIFLADLIENTCILAMLKLYPDLPPWLVQLGSLVTQAKWLMLVFLLTVIIVGIIAVFTRGIRTKGE